MFLAVIRRFPLLRVVNFWPGDDFLGSSSAKTSIFPCNFLERQSCRDPYLSIRLSRRTHTAQIGLIGGVRQPEHRHGDVHAAMSTRVGLIRSLFKTAQLAEPASPRYPGCRNRREDYLVLVQERLQRWHNRRYDPNMWPLIINDKLLGYAFAHSIGVRTPRVLFCSADGLAGLPAKWPAAWGPRFAALRSSHCVRHKLGRRAAREQRRRPDLWQAGARSSGRAGAVSRP